MPVSNREGHRQEQMKEGAKVISRNENVQGVVLESAARAATNYSEIFENDYHRGIKIFIDATAKADTPSVTFSIQERDPVGRDFKTILTSAAVTDAVTAPVVLTVYPGCVAVTNLVLNEPLSREWRVVATHADADSLTYSVGYCYIV